jgi:hypothetical protein
MKTQYKLLLALISIGLCCQLSCSISKKRNNKSEIEHKSEWIKITKDNQGQTATNICRKYGYELALKAKRCLDVSKDTIDISDTSYKHKNCIASARTYADCFKFYGCEDYKEIKDDDTTSYDGVFWDCILCTK